MTATQINTVLFVNKHTLECTLSLAGTRLLDVLNDPRSDFLQLLNVRVFLPTYDKCTASFQESVMPKSSIRMAIPTAEKHEAPEKRCNAFTVKRRVPLFLLVEDFEICGTVQLTGHDDAVSALTRELGRFIPLNDVTLHHRGRPLNAQPLQVVFVNKSLLEVVQIGEAVSVSPPTPEKVRAGATQMEANRAAPCSPVC